FRHPFRNALVQEVRSLEVGGDEFVEALFGSVQQIATLARRHAGIVHQQVERWIAFACKCKERGPIGRAPDVTLKNVAAGLRLQRLRGVFSPAVSSDHLMCSSELRRDGATNSPARARNNRGWLHQKRTALSRINVRRV